ncbi:acetyl-CoA carboxylase biotin carboxyl carrier protein [Clostridium tyrobutyricum]|uniref:acetyl-CoA carboxylase biotin carboxyl carrier protein n=1 Tax=Clostridium tyrobutyricum TaxID=1519 RepID=UPI001C39424C|nr:acetyl-CoA carboxylase biotin carboxyl carrier protein [Clostridium tyrobutyricum]MBV4419590.1 acetyl-CoA carboxylase biotin carboxyl carrier protein [Clostridium tyrobutyricum]
MDFKAIEEMIQTMDSSSLGYLEVNWQDISIVMKKKGESGLIKLSHPDNNLEELKDQFKQIKESKKDTDDEEIKDIPNIKQEVKQDDTIKEIAAPIVGTFYIKSGPDKPDYVSIGDKVKKGDTLCIIEAMKIMNEIQSDVDGEIVEVVAKNQDMVEYGQTLFKIKLNS